MTYRFVADDGTEIQVPFETMMEQQGGYITVKGKLYRRAGEGNFKRKGSKSDRKNTKEIISDALGFGQHQFEEMEADRKLNGFNGVEFRQDPAVPEFYQVKCDSPRTWSKYVKHRGFVDQNSRNGGAACLTEYDMQRARELVSRTFQGRKSDGS